EKHIKYIIKATETTTATAEATKALTLGTGMTELIVLCTFLVIVQRFIRFIDFFKFFFCIFFFTYVRVIFSCQLSKSFFNFRFRCVSSNTENVIVIPFTHSKITLPIHVTYV